MGFENHIKEAIELNKHRRKLYRKKTNGESLILSNILIVSEYFVLPFARKFDRKAEAFQKDGIAIVKEDFVAMEVTDIDANVPFQNPMFAPCINEAKLILKDFKKKLDKNQYTITYLMSIHQSALAAYYQLTAIEQKYAVHFAMAKHIIESLVLIARNGIVWSNKSIGDTLKLSCDMIYFHKAAVVNSLIIDRLANPFHVKNVGIIVHDLPSIEMY